MLKRIAVLIAFLVNSCVTVNIYFPAAAVERAADEIVKKPGEAESNRFPKSSPAVCFRLRGGRSHLSVLSTQFSPKKRTSIFPIPPFAL